MKTKQTILKAFASLAVAIGAFASADAQTNLGAACGCPSVNVGSTVTRPEVLISSLPGYLPIAGTYGGELTQGANLTCDKTWILDKKIYIPSGQTLTIAPGTLIKASANLITQPANATALIIERGGDIMAQGTESCPIVFTAYADPMDGTYSISNKGMWGGVVVLGRAKNNLTLAGNGPFVPGGAGKLAVADGLGTVEGFASTNPQDQYGVATTVPTNYVSGTSPSSSTYTFDQASSSGANGAFTIVLSGNGSSVLNGMSVSGTGVAAGATVVSVSSNTVTLSLANTSAVTGNITFTGTYPLSPNTTGLFFSATAPTYSSGQGAWSAVGGTTGALNYAAPFAGATAGTFDNSDNSGVMKYISIRHSGAILAVGAEINGLTLASVGSGTTIDHIEIVSCADDNIEIFGGTVNLKYITTIFGNDDMFDYDLGWTGKAQFLFGMKGDLTFSGDSDNGIEADADDNKTNSQIVQRSHPIIYNATIIGNAKTPGNSDNSALAGINAKELTEGEIYNSIFANFRNGLNLQKAISGTRSLAQGGEAWHNWTNGTTGVTANGNVNSLKIKCNTFVNCTNPATTDASSASAGTALTGTATDAATDMGQFRLTDKNDVLVGNTLPGFDYTFTVNTTTNTFSAKNDVTPIPALAITGCPAFPNGDTFFTAADYRGAFSSINSDNWLSDWSYSSILNTTKGLVPCPADLNSDGSVNIDDFLQFLPAFGTTCN
jgi:hypothetical protein